MFGKLKQFEHISTHFEHDTEIGIRNNPDSWDSPLGALISGLQLVHRHYPTRTWSPCMRGMLLHSPRRQHQHLHLLRGAARRAAPAADARRSPAASTASKDSTFASLNADARAPVCFSAHRS